MQVLESPHIFPPLSKIIDDILNLQIQFVPSPSSHSLRMDKFYRAIINPFDEIDYCYQDCIAQQPWEYANSTMGRSKTWTHHEKKVVAAAFIAASETGSSQVGKHQKSDVLWGKVMEELRERAPLAPACNDRYHERGLTAVKSHWTVSIRYEVSKFNRLIFA